MASMTFAINEELKSRLVRFPWVNWSKVARENLLTKEELEQLHKKLESEEEKELTRWSVELGRIAKKNGLKRLLAELSQEERRELGL